MEKDIKEIKELLKRMNEKINYLEMELNLYKPSLNVFDKDENDVGPLSKTNFENTNEWYEGYKMGVQYGKKMD